MRLAIATILLAVTTAAYAQEQFVCIGTKSTGFRWDGRQWSPSGFKVDGEMYMVQEIKEETFGDRVVNFKINKFGESISYDCHRPKEGFRILCGGVAIGTVIDTKRLRFIRHYLYGYLDGDTEGDTPFILIGTCTRMR